MKFIIEFDGPLVELRRVYHEVHREIAAGVGWSARDEATFWRLTRTKGRDANLLPGARPIKLEEYHRRFDGRLEDDAIIGQYAPHANIKGVLNDLMKYGTCHLITLGANVAARIRVLDSAGLTRRFTGGTALNPDPRRRPAELRALAENDPRTVVAASSAPAIRAAGQVDLFAVGIGSGASTPARLHQAGADIVYPDLAGLHASLACGAGDLIRAGLLPPPLG